VLPAEGNDPRNKCEPLGVPRYNHYNLRLTQLEPVKNGRPMGRIPGAMLADGKVLGAANSPPPATISEP
jgi:hypothetical protein